MDPQPRNKNRLFAFLLFIGFFALYLHTAAPTVAPYRDTGEMVSVHETLGVAHPPGYPLYTLIGKNAMALPLGTKAFRSNLLSVFCGALALSFLFLVLRSWLSALPSFFGTVSFGLCNPYWELCTVSEMYSMGILFVVLILWALFTVRNASLVAFLTALALGVRMDLLLLIPLFMLVLWKQKVQKNWLGPALFFAVGAMVFFYLPLRSLQEPLVDWGNPEKIGTLLNSVMRKSYSGTLDLLSLNYRKGENFGVNMFLYAKHLIVSYGWWGALLAGGGVFWSFKNYRIPAVFFCLMFFITGPFFLFLANMPPNPHAVAIIEASYLVPDLVVGILAAFGLQAVLQKWFYPKRWAALACLFLFVNGASGVERASKRNNFYTRDYIENVRRSLPWGAITAFHKDVQLFSLWHEKIVNTWRPDIALVATGLSSSPWYWEMVARWGGAQAPPITLKKRQGWIKMKKEAGERPLTAGFETEIQAADELSLVPHGLVVIILDKGETEEGADRGLLKHLCFYRRAERYGETPDFFSTDLIGDHARAHQLKAFNLMMNNKPREAEWFFKRAMSLDPTNAKVTSDYGYLLYRENNVQSAYPVLKHAVRKFERMVERTVEYRSLPEVRKSVLRDLSNTYVYVGAAAEKLNLKEEARSSYWKGTQTFPNAQAEYNLAVTYWGEDWDRVVKHLKNAVRINPKMALAQRYLAAALARRKNG